MKLIIIYKKLFLNLYYIVYFVLKNFNIVFMSMVVTDKLNQRWLSVINRFVLLKNNKLNGADTRVLIKVNRLKFIQKIGQ